MSDEIISVIIPCYNLADYTRRCMDSILGQTYRKLEVIAVDDGSTDETPKILEEYAATDSRVVFMQQKNSGAGVAINAGIEAAKGRYIAFVDNDDWIDLHMYEKLYAALTTNNADVAVCNYNLIYEDHADYCYSTMRDEVVSVQEDVYGYFSRYCVCPQPNNYTWSRLYKADIIKNSDVRFEHFRLGADTLFNFKLLPEIGSVAFLKDGLYNYVQRSDSSVHTATQKGNIAEVYAAEFESLADYYVSKGLSEFCRVLPIYAYTRLRSTFFYSRLAGMCDDEIVEDIMRNFKGKKIADYLTGALK